MVCAAGAGFRAASQPRLLQVIGSVDRSAGGPSYMLAGFADELVRAGVRLEVITQAARHETAPLRFPEGCPVRTFRLGWPPAYGPNRRLKSETARSARAANLVHVFGLWRAINRYAVVSARRAGTPFLLSPQGMLEPSALSRSGPAKAVARWLWQDAHLRAACCLHATGEIERASIRAAGFRNPVAVIPNGISVPALESIPSRARLSALLPQLGSSAFLLYLGRIHPFKGIRELLTAWCEVAGSRPGVSLCLAGPVDRGFEAELRGLLSAKPAVGSVVLTGPVEGEAKSALLGNAKVLVLPSRSENFGMVIAESLAHGRPAIANMGAPWRALTAEACGWWIEPGARPLAAALSGALALPDQVLGEMGRRGRALAKRDYAWVKVGAMLAETYRWVLEGGPAPEWVEDG